MLGGMENVRYLYSDNHDHLMVIGGERETDVNSSACVRVAFIFYGEILLNINHFLV